jgi:sulfatase maturation enzyme AslB (radical SAM superfamily)
MSTDQIPANELTIDEATPLGEIAEAVANGVLGERVWFYANYHCNLECTYCLTESGPNVDRKMLDGAWMIARAHEAKALGFKQLGVTGGEPFMVSSMPETIAAMSDILPTVVLSNGSLFHGPRLERIVEALAGKSVHIQISLDAPEPGENDTKRGDDNWRQVSEAVPRLVSRGLKVRIATTTEGITDESLNELCVLHREWGVPDEDHVVRPIVSRGRAALDGIGVAATQQDLPAELCLTTDGAFWSAFGPTIRNGRTDTDLLITRVTAPLERPAKAMLRVAQATPAGADASLGIR